ncbi:MAG: AAA family ATPase, partial [Nanoarchaeota archaeon]|nr:AAA family ATPase [Nanoarchaeota archaeon]
MTIINKITAKGFKSFAKQTEVIFGNGFNCILGPNGAGKSNIMDLLCFVLGKTSAKSLRAAKSANLIYNGGKKGTPSKEAECSIFFDNSSKKFPVESSELKITRKVKHSGNSIYKINDEVRTRQQVVDMLRGANIEPDGHNIILQGDIARFMEMKPVDRRELVEEIAGISIWEDKKQKSLKELDKVEERLKEAKIMIAEREKYLKELKKDRDKALKYKEFEINAKNNKATYLYLQIKDKTAKKEEADSRLNKQKQDLEKIKNNISEIGQKIDDKKEEVKKLSEDMNAKGDDERRKINKDMRDLSEFISRDDERLNTCKSEITKLIGRMHQLKQELQDHDKSIHELDLRREDLNTKVISLTKQEKTIQEEIDEFKTKFGIKDSNFDTKLDDLEKEVESKQEEILSKQEDKQALIAKKTELGLQIRSADEKINELMNIQKADQEKVEQLKKSREDFGIVVKDLAEISEKDSKYAADLANVTKKLTGISEELARL